MRKLELLDIGARDGLQWPWNRIPESVSPTLVEPDPEEAERLRAQGHSVLEVALWHEPSPVSLHITRSPGGSSVFRPARAFLDQFPESGRFDITHSIKMEATTLDSLSLQEIDFLKIDTQGSELAILQGGVTQLQRLVGLEVEVEFAQMYEGQPLFADVDKFVRERLGLELWDIRRTHWKHKAGLGTRTSKGRLIFGDALYLRPMATLELWRLSLGADGPNKLAMLALSAIAYGFLDYAQVLLTLRAFPPEAAELLSAQIRRPTFRPLRNGNARLFTLLDALAKAFRPWHRGWAVAEELGSRRRGPFWC